MKEAGTDSSSFECISILDPGTKGSSQRGSASGGTRLHNKTLLIRKGGSWGIVKEGQTDHWGIRWVHQWKDAGRASSSGSREGGFAVCGP